VEVRVFGRQESVDFLLKRTGHKNQAAAAQLAAALGDLPLALDQASAYLEAAGRSFTEYLALFTSRRKDLWERETTPLNYPDTVATTWSLAIERLRQESPASVDLLNLCAFLAPNDMPRSALSQAAGHLPEPLAGVVADPLSFDDAIVALRRYSLLEARGDSLSVHRLVQAVVRDRLDEGEQRRFAASAVGLVNSSFPFDSDDVGTWPVCASLLPHALAALGHAEAMRAAPEEVGRLLNQIGLYLRGRADFAEAKAILTRALASGEASHGPDHPTVATRVNNLGLVLRDLRELAVARTCYERALQIFRDRLGEDHPRTVTVRNNLHALD
jgi:tetratricopeptide (TPR) repeat protein